MPWSATMTYRPQVTAREESICAENPRNTAPKRRGGPTGTGRISETR